MWSPRLRISVKIQKNSVKLRPHKIKLFDKQFDLFIGFVVSRADSNHSANNILIALRLSEDFNADFFLSLTSHPRTRQFSVAFMFTNTFFKRCANKFYFGLFWFIFEGVMLIVILRIIIKYLLSIVLLDLTGLWHENIFAMRYRFAGEFIR